MSVSITKMMNSLLKNLEKNGRMTIDFSKNEDVEFFTSMLKKASRRSVKADSDDEATERVVKPNSYITFCNETRTKTDFSDIKDPRDVSRRLGEMWRALSDEEKESYKKRAETVEHKPKEKKVKTKKPLSAFIKFCNAHRAEVATTVKSPQDVSRRLGEMWKTLSPEQKEQWKGEQPVDQEVIQPVPAFIEPMPELEIPEDEEPNELNYEQMPLQQLKEIAKSKGIKGFSKMKKPELIQAIAQ